jgi:hypothetical protein
VRRLYPVVLVAHGFPVNPITMSELHERVARAGLLQGSHLGRLEIIDLDELEQIEALHESGGPSLASLLADKQTANLYRTALNQTSTSSDGFSSPGQTARVARGERSWRGSRPGTCRSLPRGGRRRGVRHENGERTRFMTP